VVPKKDTQIVNTLCPNFNERLSEIILKKEAEESEVNDDEVIQTHKQRIKQLMGKDNVVFPHGEFTKPAKGNANTGKAKPP
jgi:hypothetical protein